MFAMDRERFLQMLEKLEGLDVGPGEWKSMLNEPAALDDAGRSSLLLGTGFISAGAAIGLLKTSSYMSVLGVFSVCAGLFLLARGCICYFRSARRRASALDAARRLEGEDGYLWRFERFLEDWEGDLPDPVRATLPVTCQASKDHRLSASHHDLRAYWYWVEALQGRMDESRRYLDW
jgi:hypothetical protein